jgi:hypothetical protein
MESTFITFEIFLMKNCKLKNIYKKEIKNFESSKSFYFFFWRDFSPKVFQQQQMLKISKFLFRAANLLEHVIKCINVRNKKNWEEIIMFLKYHQLFTFLSDVFKYAH